MARLLKLHNGAMNEVYKFHVNQYCNLQDICLDLVRMAPKSSKNTHLLDLPPSAKELSIFPFTFCCRGCFSAHLQLLSPPPNTSPEMSNKYTSLFPHKQQCLMSILLYVSPKAKKPKYSSQVGDSKCSTISGIVNLEHISSGDIISFTLKHSYL